MDTQSIDTMQCIGRPPSAPQWMDAELMLGVLPSTKGVGHAPQHSHGLELSCFSPAYVGPDSLSQTQYLQENFS